MNNSQADFTFSDVSNRLLIEDDRAVFKRTQDIGNHFLSDLASQRAASVHAPIGDFHHVCSIPVVVIEKWFAEGFNIYDKNVTAKDILKRLQSQDMTGLMATSKSVI